MKDNKIVFEDGQLVNPGYVQIDGVNHEVTEAEYEGNTPLSAYNLNLMQDNLRENISTNESNIGTDTDTYDNTATYAVGEIVIYENQLYKCITAVDTAEEFDKEKWKKTSLKEMIDVHVVTETETDLNNYISNGVFYFGSDYTPTNIPAGVNGALVVIVGTGFIKQLWFRHGTANTNDYQTYIRTCTSDTWSDWQKLIVENDLFYSKGDSFSYKAYVACLGHLSSSKTQILFNLPIDKRLDKISNIDCEKLIVNVRTISGSYLLQNIDLKELVTSEAGTLSLNKASNNSIRVVYASNTAFSDCTNNTPLSVDVLPTSVFYFS